MKYKVTEEWQANFLFKKRVVVVINEFELKTLFPDAVESLQSVSKVILNRRQRASGIPTKVMIEKMEGQNR